MNIDGKIKELARVFNSFISIYMEKDKDTYKTIKVIISLVNDIDNRLMALELASKGKKARKK